MIFVNPFSFLSMLLSVPHLWLQVARATGVADECLANMRTVRAFAMEDSEKNLFIQELDKSRKLNEALGMGIGIFQVCGGLTNLMCERSIYLSLCIPD